ncbi:PadR family transcriptional regulator [Streptomyces sp. NA04227]|uniref:PadR family transcriptional regulator n=1 Tax=Streptomyces sp. NA04227 TaxID=2742136 RepID=UPI001592106C|nr:PadR family transcriptional regulator [Streptomyces sp. NA04227]QKW05169.1 PadR family transcriptional regulator [Streptomyces sp. NA04227]
MSLPHAILIALLEKPSSGLELTRRFDKSIGYFWQATHQQIYRELGKLERQGHIRAIEPAQPAQGQRKEYEVLPAGREELRRWTAESDEPRRPRDPLMLRLRAAGVLGTEGVADELRRHLALHQRQLADYEEIEKRDVARSKDTERDRMQRLVLRGGIMMETFWVEWLAEALREFPGTEAAETEPGTEQSSDTAPRLSEDDTA